MDNKQHIQYDEKHNTVATSQAISQLAFVHQNGERKKERKNEGKIK